MVKIDKIVSCEIKAMKEKRPEALNGRTYRLKTGEMEHSLYITITDHTGADGQTRPFEVFINSRDMSAFQWIVALTRMISARFRNGEDPMAVIQDMQNVHDPKGGFWYKRHHCPSIVAAIGDIIGRHCYGEDKEPLSIQEGRECPKCHAKAVIKKDGCDTCLACGEGKCS